MTAFVSTTPFAERLRNLGGSSSPPLTFKTDSAPLAAGHIARLEEDCYKRRRFGADLGLHEFSVTHPTPGSWLIIWRENLDPERFVSEEPLEVDVFLEGDRVAVAEEEELERDGLD